MTYRLLTTGELISVHVVSIVRSCARLVVRRIRRTRSKVEMEYDAGHWARIYRQRAWERAPNLQTFLVGTNQKLLTAEVDGCSCRISQADYYQYRLKALANSWRAISPTRVTWSSLAPATVTTSSPSALRFPSADSLAWTFPDRCRHRTCYSCAFRASGSIRVRHDRPC